MSTKMLVRQRNIGYIKAPATAPTAPGIGRTNEEFDMSDDTRPTEPKFCASEGCRHPHSSRGYCAMHYQRLRRRGLMPPIVKPTDSERFWSKVDKSRDCWTWTGTILRSTHYGVFSVSHDGHSRKVPAHCYSYEDQVGPIPDGLFLDHQCRNRQCVNPEHLRPVTQKQNSENLDPGPGRSNNTSGVRGVYFVKSRNKWRATVQMKVSVGEYDTLDEAEAAVIAKRNELHTHNATDRP